MQRLAKAVGRIAPRAHLQLNRELKGGFMGPIEPGTFVLLLFIALVAFWLTGYLFVTSLTRAAKKRVRVHRQQRRIRKVVKTNPLDRFDVDSLFEERGGFYYIKPDKKESEVEK